MSEQNQTEQNATPAELTDESLENVAGGTVSETGSCIPEFPGCILFPQEPTSF